MAKVEEQESNDNEGSIQSSLSKENDIKNRLRKNINKKKVSNSDDLAQKKIKKVSGSYWREPCKEILETLKKDEKAALFRHPAVRSFAKQEDKEFYKEQIKEPRDLGTITKKLKYENYTPKDFRNDIELCWSNALTFNESDTEVYHYAEYLKELSDKLFKEKGFEEILEKYNNEKENNNMDDKDMITNDNTNNSNNNSNDSNHTGDKLNLNESGLLENGLKEKNGDNDDNDNDSDKDKKKEKKRKDSSDTNSSNKSNKDEESFNESETKKHHHHHHKMTGKKRRRHRHKDKEKDKDKSKEEKNGEEKKEKKRGRKRRKLDNDDIIKISKRKINFEDLKKKYPINYPVIASPEEIEKMAKKNGKNKIKKMVKLNNTNKNHDNHHKTERKRRGRNANNNSSNINSVDKTKKRTYKFDWEFLEKGEEQKVDFILIDNKNYFERRKIENEQMANYDINCNSDIIQVTHRHRNTNATQNINNNINGISENIQQKKKNEITKNKNINNSINTNLNNSNNNISNVSINNNDNEINKEISNIEIVQKSNNVSMDNSINEIKMINEINNAVKIVDKTYDKSMELRIEIAKNFDNLTDSNMIDLLVYIENIRPQAIRILENDTIYIDMEAFNEDTFNRVFDYIKNFV